MIWIWFLLTCTSRKIRLVFPFSIFLKFDFKISKYTLVTYVHKPIFVSLYPLQVDLTKARLPVHSIKKCININISVRMPEVPKE